MCKACELATMVGRVPEGSELTTTIGDVVAAGMAVALFAVDVEAPIPLCNYHRSLALGYLIESRKQAGIATVVHEVTDMPDINTPAVGGKN